MEWAKPQFSRNQVDRAGDILTQGEPTHEDLAFAFNVINNWRASHSFPLNNFQVNLRTKVKTIEKKDVLVAQRLKRLDSIRDKLAREQTRTLQLSQMQDIGGCRAIVSSVQNVYRLVTSYNRSKFNHKCRSKRDYIESPKNDGYRGYHLVYQYYSLGDQISDYDKLRIEIQIRSRPQHIWATAVEAVGIFTKQALKSNQGDQDWLEFFKIMSSVIAGLERCPLVPGTATEYGELREQIVRLAASLNAVQLLEAHRVALEAAGKLNKSQYLLVHYDSRNSRLYLRPFSAADSQGANFAYTETEKNKSYGDNVVLVKVDSVRNLRRAYPNFFFDTHKFTELLKEIIQSNVPPSIASVKSL